MNTLPTGYTSRGDGTYSKHVEWVQRGRNWVAPATLVRSRTGRLLRVERTRNALSRRAPAEGGDAVYGERPS